MSPPPTPAASSLSESEGDGRTDGAGAEARWEVVVAAGIAAATFGDAGVADDAGGGLGRGSTGGKGIGGGVTGGAPSAPSDAAMAGTRAGVARGCAACGGGSKSAAESASVR